MPSRPKRPCSYPGCPKLTDGQYCEDHAAVARRQYNRYERAPDINKKYGRAWKRIRDRHISQHPLCEQCEKEGKLIPAAEVHHKIPISKGGTHARENLMSLCRSCHNKIHHALIEEDGFIEGFRLGGQMVMAMLFGKDDATEEEEPCGKKEQ